MGNQTLTCPNGHQNPSGQPYCGTCGAKVPIEVTNKRARGPGGILDPKIASLLTDSKSNSKPALVIVGLLALVIAIAGVIALNLLDSEESLQRGEQNASPRQLLFELKSKLDRTGPRCVEFRDEGWVYGGTAYRAECVLSHPDGALWPGSLVTFVNDADRDAWLAERGADLEFLNHRIFIETPDLPPITGYYLVGPRWLFDFGPVQRFPQVETRVRQMIPEVLKALGGRVVIRGEEDSTVLGETPSDSAPNVEITGEPSTTLPSSQARASSPEEAAVQFFQSWYSGDKARAMTVGSREAVEFVFREFDPSHFDQAPTDESTGCVPRGDAFSCYDIYNISLLVEETPDGFWVKRATYVEEPLPCPPDSDDPLCD